MFTKILKSTYGQLARGFSSQVVRLPGNSQKASSTKDVNLRGTFIKGNFDDLPNLIFFPELCDPSSNWTAFFTDPENQFLNYRNVWLVDPRNFGNSDHHQSFDLSEMAEDVVRFMYQNKISTATVAGHGFGAKLAVAVGCYHPERVTGVFGIDGAPMDQRYHEPFHEFRNYLEKLNEVNLRSSRGDVEAHLKHGITDPKWRAIFSQNIKRTTESGFDWGFNLKALLHNVRFNKADCVGNWTESHGIYGGRAQFIFPDHSRWIHLNTNTLPIHKVCVQTQGYGIDIFAVQGDEHPLNHWVYELDHYAFPISRKFVKFLSRYDGVHILLKDRSEVGKFFIPDVPNSRKNPDHINRNYSPAHLHHNWRYNNIYEEADKYEKERNAQIANTEEAAKKK